MNDLQEQTQLLRQVRLALQDHDYATAIAGLERIIAMASAREDWSAAARHMGNLALTYYRYQQPQRAVECFGQAIQYARRDHDKLTENGLLGNMGNVLRELGYFDEAVRCLNQALLIAQEIGDQRGRGIWLTNLGLVYDDMRQPQQAADLHAQAVEVARQLHDTPNLASRLGHLGNSLIAQNRAEEALPYFQEAAALYHSVGKESEYALRLGIIGNLYAHLGRAASPAPSAFMHFANALESYQTAAQLADKLNDHVSTAELLKSIANVLVEIGQIDEAKAYLQSAYARFMQLNMRHRAEDTARALKILQDYRK